MKVAMAVPCEHLETTCREGQLGPSSWIGAKFHCLEALPSSAAIQPLLSIPVVHGLHPQPSPSYTLRTLLLENSSWCHQGPPSQQRGSSPERLGSIHSQLSSHGRPRLAQLSTVRSGWQVELLLINREHPRRMNRERHDMLMATLVVRAAAGGGARMTTQGSQLWAQSLPWVGQVTWSTALSLGGSSVNRACLSLSFTVGETRLWMFSCWKKHSSTEGLGRRCLHCPPLQGLGAGFSGEQVSARHGHVAACPGT